MTPHDDFAEDLKQKPIRELIEDVTASSREALEKGARAAAEVTELETRARQAMDWRRQLDRHPWLLLGIAIGAVVLLYIAIPSRD
jgi:hypothetical protein